MAKDKNVSKATGFIAEVLKAFTLPYEGVLAIGSLFRATPSTNPNKKTSIALKSLAGIVSAGAIIALSLGYIIALPILYINLATIGAFSKGQEQYVLQKSTQKRDARQWGMLALQLGLCLGITAVIVFVPGVREIALLGLLGLSIFSLVTYIKSRHAAQKWEKSTGPTVAPSLSSSTALDPNTTLTFAAEMPAEQFSSSNLPKDANAPSAQLRLE